MGKWVEQEQRRWVEQMIKNIRHDYGVPLVVDTSAEGMRFQLDGRYIGPRFSKWHGGLNGAEQFLNGFIAAMDFQSSYKRGESLMAYKPASAEEMNNE